MSAEEHRHEAASHRGMVHVLTVSSSRTLDEDASGSAIAAALEEAGHTVVGRQLVPDEVGAIRAVVRDLSDFAEADVLVVTGGTGVTATDCTPDALEPLFTRALPGFGELFRRLSYDEIGAAAMLSRATAGLVGPLVVFALPGSTRACDLALRALIVPELPHLLAQVRRDGPPAPAPEPEDDHDHDHDHDHDDDDHGEGEDDPDVPALPAPSGKLGRLGNRALSFSVTAGVDEAAPLPEAEDGTALPGSGWKRAVHEISGEVRFDLREELPQPIEKLAPIVNVLETAGETAVLVLPSGIKYSLWGWPDLRRPGSKVLAVGWGQPLAEVLALHRYPVQTGTSIEERHGLLPGRGDVGRAVEAITTRPPPGDEGELFAVQGDAVWVQRGTRVIRWDGRRERDDGNIKQALASLVLDWSSR